MQNLEAGIQICAAMSFVKIINKLFNTTTIQNKTQAAYLNTHILFRDMITSYGLNAL